MELLAYRGIRDRNFDITFWRTKTGLEVNFILGQQVAIEVTLTTSVAKSDIKGLLAFQQEHGTQKNYVISKDAFKRKMVLAHTEILILPYQDFLQMLWDGEII